MNWRAAQEQLDVACPAMESIVVASNNSMQPTALCAAADAERWTDGPSR
jgi:hypothetical protein